MVRAMRLSIEAVDTRLENAARTLGASPWRAFLTVTLPLSMPGILAAVALGFARSLGEFGATVSFVSSIPGETRTLPLAIYGAMQLPAGETQVLRLSLVSIALALGMLLVSELLLRRQPGRQHEL
jgi:molybdate transport system permease protein